MNVAWHITRARRLWGVDSHQYDDDDAIIDLNIRYHDIEDAITKLQEDFFWDDFYTITVIDQEEYTIPEDATKILWVSIKYSADDEYKTARLVDINNLDFDRDWYKLNQSSSDPIYHISDNSYFIYPVPSEAVSEWIKVTAIQKLPDLTLSSTEADIFAGKIDARYHSILDIGLLEDIYLWKQSPNEASLYGNKYEVEKSRIIKRLTRRYNWAIQVQNPNLKNYC